MSREKNSHLRRRIAQLAARLMADEGIPDYGHAKRKAGRQLGVSDDRCMPTNAEIEEEIRIFHEIYNSEDQAETLRQLRQDALAVMQMLERFDPHLTGAVLDGTAGRHSAIEIHLYAESLKEVEIYLLNQQIPYESNEKSYRMHGDKHGNGRRKVPVFTLEGPNGLIRLSVFDREAHKTHVRSPVDGQNLHRANLASVNALLKPS
ncbi:MAG TPA: hypothetical protein VIK69_09580 [Methylophilaceae bacterium]|jgi:hypothetical protein